ncbi:MaoC/PaaZ C-terminal domain-containing protein [Variovorax humicola]|uniref:MaoC/PaaZ C-terminal domain-containing protein n=1 Tax=Variovorax humicola TaxID=1769758 RepID=A0ABU8W4Q2_9BURK
MFDPERLLAWSFKDVRCAYADTDAILYSLAIGIGADPTDERQLRYVFEKNLKAFPTLALVLRHPSEVGFLDDPEVGIDMQQMLHGETGLRIHRPLPSSGVVVSRTSIDRLVDRGEGKGALLYFSRTVRHEDTGALLATETGSFFLRGNGGFGGEAGVTNKPAPVPARAADLQCEMSTLAQSALLYRLTGDRNPLHADPVLARRTSFDRPILHGSCTYGHTAHAIVKLLCNYDGDRLRRLDLRFTSPVYPGETLNVEVWRLEPGIAAFRVSVPARGVIAVDNGICEFEEKS